MAWNQAPSKSLVISVVDFNGKIATTNYWVDQSETDPGGGGCQELVEGVAGITAGAVAAVALQARAVNSAPGVPATGPYDSVQDKLDLLLSCDDGSTITLQLPGPLASCLATDNYHVNPAATNIAALIGVLKTSAKSASGATITGLANGYRRIPPRLKKK